MASGNARNDDGYPWLSWARTGILTLAGVLTFGLAESAWHPLPSPPAQAGGEAAKAAKSAVPASTATLPADSAAPAFGSSAGPSPANPPKPDLVAPKEIPAHDPAPQPPAEEPAPAPQPKPQPAPRAGDKTSSPLPVAKVPANATAEPKAESAKPPAVQDPAKRDAFVHAVADVRAAMSARKLAASKRSLTTASAQVQSEADQAELDRLGVLQDHLEQFWELVRKSVAAMQPADEIEISDSNRVAVIEASREMLTVRREGRSQRYRIEALPGDLLMGIVKSSFQSTPGTKLILGSFLAMDTQGNRARALKLWQEAIRGGESQGTLLLPEMNVPPAGRGK